MEQSVRLSKNQLRNLRRKATKEMQKIQQKQEESSTSSEGKVMIGFAETEVPQNQDNQNLLSQLDKMKILTKKQEETIYNQREKIRELMNNIDDQNNELLILRRQLIQNNLVTEQQLYQQSQQIFNKEEKMVIENDQVKLIDQEIQQDKKTDLNLQKRIEILEQKVFPKKKNEKQTKSC